MNRPTGVTVIAALVIGALTPIFASGPGTLIGAGLGIVGIVILLDGIIHLLVGVGILNLQNWAWWVAVIVSGLTILGAIIELVSRGRVNWISSIISVIIFVYLMMPDIRAHFGQGRGITAG